MDVENEKAVYTGAYVGAAAEPIKRIPGVLEKMCLGTIFRYNRR